MKVLKFGGTSLGSASALAKAADIVFRARAEGPIAVVVSAFSGTTTALSEAAAEAVDGTPDHHRATVDQIRERHREVSRELGDNVRDRIAAETDRRLARLSDLLRGVQLLGECSLQARDSILAIGELLSAELFAAVLNQRRARMAEAFDARNAIVTDESFGAAIVDMAETSQRLRAQLPALSRDLSRHADPNAPAAIITGFIASSKAGLTTTLGRGGSDYTAAIVGAALGADAIELWTDVSGVLSADPRAVKTAFPLPHLSYRELMELSHFGAKVVFPASVHPARGAGIPLVIKNTFDPKAPGTLVTDQAPTTTHAIRGISSIEEVALLQLEGDGMVGVPGIAMRLFGALARREISVILITQSSSEHSICVAIAPDQLALARQAVEREFALEQQLGLVDPLVIEERLSIIAVVGDQMRHTPGIANRVFAALGQRHLNVKAIAQGSSELNISLVVAAGDRETALRAVHDSFFSRQTAAETSVVVAVAIVGIGGVGTALLEQFSEQTAQIERSNGIELRLIALARSNTMVVDRQGLELERGPALLAANGRDFDLDSIAQSLLDCEADRSVFVDCTASPEAAGWYPKLLRAGIGVVTANKIPFAQSCEQYGELIALARQNDCPLRYETTVGAGLPIVATASSMTSSGDRVSTVSGVLSGTLNVVLEGLRNGQKFSTAVHSAHSNGLTEPNPYHDLSGVDVLRKLTIIARVAGHPLETSAVELDPILPQEPWSRLSLDEFWQRLPMIDESLAARRLGAEDNRCRLRYVASFHDGRDGKEGKARVGLSEVEADHPCFDIEGPDNLVAFHSRHYRGSPIVIRGPGAGPEVTAAGLLADIVAATRPSGFDCRAQTWNRP